MSLQERLVEDLKNAMRQGDELTRSTLRLVRAAIQNEEISRRQPLDDQAVIDVMSRLARQHEESIAQFRKGNRSDLVERENSELAILRLYLPEQLTLAEIVELAQQAITEVGATGAGDLGKVMGRLMPRVSGRADGGRVNQAVSELLEG